MPKTLKKKIDRLDLIKIKNLRSLKYTVTKRKTSHRLTIIYVSYYINNVKSETMKCYIYLLTESKVRLKS